tara:strand:+ start:472 stop:1503 length:1032 start_codon:yes stop_codon:yes gene_type:complete
MVQNYTPKNTNKFLVYRSNKGGMGDRLLGAISTFILAYVNDYEFRIEDFKPISFVEIFTSPYYWWQKDWYDSPYKRGRLNLESSYEEYSNVITGGTISDHYPNSDVISVYCNQNFISQIYKNPIYKSKLEKEGIREDEAFIYALNFIFDLEDEYKKNYVYLKHKLTLGVENLIGVHLRTNWNWGDVPEIKSENIDLFVEAIKNNTPPNSRVLLCTDHPPLVDIIKEKLPMIDIKTVKGAPVHLEKTLDYEMKDMLKIIYEIWLLSECKVFIGSYWSNFSRLAVLKSNNSPILIEMMVNETASERTEFWLKQRDKNITLEESYRIPMKIRGINKYPPLVLQGLK